MLVTSNVALCGVLDADAECIRDSVSLQLAYRPVPWLVALLQQQLAVNSTDQDESGVGKHFDG